jgi:hypothetical protein
LLASGVRGIVMEMSKDIYLISIMPEDGIDEAAVRLDDQQLRILHAALLTLTGTSGSAMPFSAAVAAAIEHGNSLVIGCREAPSASAEKNLHARMNALTDQLMPDLDLPSDAAAVLARRNAKHRTELLREFGALSGEQIAEERSRAANRHALAARWRKEGRLFGVPYRGQTLYPAFQFDDDGVLRPVISEVLAALPRDEMSEWEVALWWTAGHGALGGRRPVDLLDEQPEQLVHAARRLSEPLPV